MPLAGKMATPMARIPNGSAVLAVVIIVELRASVAIHVHKAIMASTVQTMSVASKWTFFDFMNTYVYICIVSPCEFASYLVHIQRDLTKVLRIAVIRTPNLA